MAEDIGGEKVIKSKVSRQDMAKIVGASREMVSRVMKDLESAASSRPRRDGSLKIQNRKA